MNKRKIISCFILVFILICGGIYFYIHRNQPITNFFNNEDNKINKISILNGNNGEISTIEDEKTITYFSKYLSNIKLKKIYDSHSSTGWSYQFSIYEEGKKQIDITFLGDEACIINNSKYLIKKSTNITIDSVYNKAKESISN